MSTPWYERTLPETDAGLYDLLRELFGIGTFDDIATINERWHEARMREIAKIKSTRRSRNVTVADLAITALYCHSHHIPVLYVSQLYARIRPATAAYRNARSEVASRGEDVEYAAAIDYEQQQRDGAWLSRLLRASGQAHRQHTLAEWKKARRR